MKHIDLKAEDIVLEITDKLNKLIDAVNTLEEQGVFVVPKAPTPEGKALNKAVERDAQKEDEITITPHQ